MSHKHVTVTLDAETVANIEAALEGGETVADRVRALVERHYGEDDRPHVEFVDDCSM